MQTHLLYVIIAVAEEFECERLVSGTTATVVHCGSFEDVYVGRRTGASDLAHVHVRVRVREGAIAWACKLIQSTESSHRHTDSSCRHVQCQDGTRLSVTCDRMQSSSQPKTAQAGPCGTHNSKLTDRHSFVIKMRATTRPSVRSGLCLLSNTGAKAPIH
jgi:hypothetical protein